MRKTEVKHNRRKNGPAKHAKERSERAKSKNRRRMLNRATAAALASDVREIYIFKY